jgi:hypothetical protein
MDTLALGTTMTCWGIFLEGGETRLIFSWKKMTSCIRFEDRLEGISNYLQWKVRITSVIKENKLWSFLDTIMPILMSYPIALGVH